MEQRSAVPSQYTYRPANGELTITVNNGFLSHTLTLLHEFPGGEVVAASVKLADMCQTEDVLTALDKVMCRQSDAPSPRRVTCAVWVTKGNGDYLILKGMGNQVCAQGSEPSLSLALQHAAGLGALVSHMAELPAEFARLHPACGKAWVWQEFIEADDDDPC